MHIFCLLFPTGSPGGRGFQANVDYHKWQSEAPSEISWARVPGTGWWLVKPPAEVTPSPTWRRFFLAYFGFVPGIRPHSTGFPFFSCTFQSTQTRLVHSPSESGSQYSLHLFFFPHSSNFPLSLPTKIGICTVPSTLRQQSFEVSLRHIILLSTLCR